MDRTRLLRALPALLAPVALALVLIASRFPSLAPAGLVPQPLWIAALAVLLLAASLYRPLALGENPAPGLRLGAAVAPPLVVLSGAAPAAAAAGVALLLRPPVHRWLSRRCALPREQPIPWLTLLAAAGGGALAVLAAGAAWSWLSPVTAGWTADPTSPAVVLSTSFIYLLFLAVFAWATACTQHPPAGAELGLFLVRSVALDLAGWLFGIVLTVAAAGTNGGIAALLLLGLAALALEAERQRLLRRGMIHRVQELDRVRQAGDRLVASERGELDAVVARIATEVGNVLPWQWFELAVTVPEEESREFHAGPGGRLESGPASPDPYPTSLPGMHKRAEWRTVDRHLSAEGQRVAHLKLWCDPRRMEQGDLVLFDNLLPHMAASIQRAILDREAKEDPLTGVAVRRVLERRLQEVYRRILDRGGSMAVLMCDLDHFKRINDTYGHDVGDRALVAAARAFETALRAKSPEGDLLARYGGEEFTVLLEGATGRDALAVAERLRLAVAEVELADEGTGERIPLTVSVGAASFPELHVKTATELVLLADEALYEAKRQGRNRALLDLGQGVYRDGAGETVEAMDRPQPPPPPRIFS